MTRGEAHDKARDVVTAGGGAPSGATRLARLRRLLRHASRRSPYFQASLGGLQVDSILDERDFASRVPLSDLEGLEAARAATGDPFSGRKCAPECRGQLVFQLESDGEVPLYVALGRSEAQSYARALGRCWRLLGLDKGDRVAIFDFGSSPLSYLASGAFLPYVSRGAADGLACIPVCNDGVSQMGQRAVEIARFVRPRAFFVRSDCMFPFIQEAERQGISLRDYIGAIVVAENEGLPSARSCRAWADALGLPVYRLLRVDAAMFLGIECPSCGLLHVDSGSYFVETVVPGRGRDADSDGGGRLAITNLFARLTPAIRYACPVLAGRIGPGCPLSPEDDRFRLV
ncbi:MAG: hypothetical protein HY671_11625 [Chloroflexi bacterium]|nr:hypothetical protein [Chloroflexota bacterium]